MHDNGMGCCKCAHMLVATLQRRGAGQGKGATPPSSSTHPNYHSAAVFVTAAVAMASRPAEGKRNNFTRASGSRKGMAFLRGVKG